ncbi:MAG: cation transporter [Brumimicrobium sp.]|nr:cation transporter [Brumimicrobium sp.]MCO5267406.1 cation transporter [Brumimicrobium sp.]
MKELKFKTSLSCGGCKNKITPGMDAIEGIDNWDVDLESADKILTVTSENDVEKEVINAVEKVGFVIEKV